MIMCVIFVLTVGGSQWATASDYKIEQVTQNVYRFVADRHRSVFLVTENGILITDPMNTEAATWLKKELKDRFNLPVKEVFKDSQPLLVSSQLAKQDLVVTRADTVIPEVISNRFFSVSAEGKNSAPNMLS